MYKLFNENDMVSLCCDAFEAECVKRALMDLNDDICRVSGKKAEMNQYLPAAGADVLIAGTLTNIRFTAYLKERGVDVSAIEGTWENYMIRTMEDDHGCLLIAGSDKRGTMWGIYEFAERFLGIDPLYLWTDQDPVRKKEMVIPDILIMDGPRTYKFRGWFINDEDLIEGFSRQGVPERDYHFHNDYAPFLDMLIETGLRLKQNLLIPCSHLDLDNPAEEDIVRRITERGMYISMHHQEPVGVHQFTIDRYWQKRGVSDVNFLDDPEKYREVWAHYIHKWAKYDDVIWQLGLRGRGDRPLWYNNSNIPDSQEDRGRIISEAIRMQMDIVKEECAGKPVLSSSTLWMEGMSLYKNRVLSFPEDTMVIFADFGPDQMWGEGYDTAPRLQDTEYGVYYHAAFWGCGPHLVQGNRPEKIYYNYKNAVEKGDTRYSILNVANFREFVYQIRCVAEITWDIDRFQTDSYRLEWCRKAFGTKAAAETARIYQEYFDCFYEMDNTLIPGQMLLMDGMLKRVALKLMEIIRGKELKQEDIQNKRLYDFKCTDDFIGYYREAAVTGIRRFKALYHREVLALNLITEERKQFFINNMIVQTEIIMGLYSWVYNLTLAAVNRREGGAEEEFKRNIDDAVFALDHICMGRRKAVSGKWTHWYDGDNLINLNQDIRLTEGLHLDCLMENAEIDILNAKF